jgi:hypothetical protein
VPYYEEQSLPALMLIKLYLLLLITAVYRIKYLILFLGSNANALKRFTCAAVRAYRSYIIRAGQCRVSDIRFIAFGADAYVLFI